MKELKIVDFTKYPGPRYKELGSNSGEAYREEYLIPELRKDDEIVIDLDGVLGYGSSFLDEIFGGIVRAMSTHPETKSKKQNEDEIVKYEFITKEHIEFIRDNIKSEDESWIRECQGYINDELAKVK